MAINFRTVQQFLDSYDTISLTLAANDEQIVGRTTIQKLIYFEDILIPEIKLIEPYVAYFYGPFNKEVAKSLEQMVVFNILEEKTLSGRHEGYLYRVSEKGTPIMSKLLDKYNKSYIKIENLVNICYEHCKLDPNVLSFAAKIHYILNSNNKMKKMNNDNLVKIANNLGWKISKSEINQGVGLLEKLQLVKIA
ncbi:MAG TPA: hypothetical protein VN704_00085 [Verrucomicrobiae bacterium]|nr:hypothetical protein [Verrucomicrobiae bacterium]